MPENDFLFICGLHGSGTSLVFKVLRDHPQISGFKDTGASEDEDQHLQSVYPRAGQFGGPGLFGHNPDSFLDETSPLATPKNAEKIFLEWSWYWDLEAPLLMEKSPPNLVRSRFLQHLFPNSRFITVLRHPLAVSLATLKWRNTSLEHGFLRVQCETCHAEHLVAFSCKRRGFCPSCGARRMAESAALLVDEVLPHEPMRQWVLSVPFPLRFLFASQPQIMGKALGIVYRTIATLYKDGCSPKAA